MKSLEATDLSDRIANLMNRKPNSLDARVARLERFRQLEGARFFMIWGRTDGELADTVKKAKANGDLRAGDKYDAKVWTSATEPPSPRFVALADMGDEELSIIADRENRPQSNRSERGDLTMMTDADLSNWYADHLPALA